MKYHSLDIPYGMIVQRHWQQLVHWIAIRWSNFTVAVSIGITATIIGFLVGMSERYGPYYPWSLGMTVLSENPAHLKFLLVYSPSVALLIAAFGLWSFLRHEYD